MPHVPYVYFFFLHANETYRILVPQPGIESMPSAEKIEHANHWTTTEHYVI